MLLSIPILDLST